MPQHARVYSTEAIVLRRTDFGEADRILTLFTPTYGKVRAIAKGARRTTSRLAGHLEPFTRTQLLLATGRDLDIVTQAEARERLDALREDLWHATSAWYIAEMVDRFLEDADPHLRLYRLFAATLRLLDDSAAEIANRGKNGNRPPLSPQGVDQISGKNGNLLIADAPAQYVGASGGRPPDPSGETHISGKNGNSPLASDAGFDPVEAPGGRPQRAENDTPAESATAPLPEGNRQGVKPIPARSWLAVRYFELHLLDELGYRPALHTCAGCDTPLRPEENGYNAELGGGLCPSCSRYAQRRLSLPALKVLRLLQTTEWEAVPRIRLDASLRAEIEGTLQSTLRFHLDRELKSWSFLHSVAGD